MLPFVARTASRFAIAAIFTISGTMHFVHAESFRRIVPPFFPSPNALVAISGICEIVGGICLLVRPVRRLAGWGLIALLIAVFPANIYMAVAPEKTGAMEFPQWLLWARLPFQLVLIAWVKYAGED